MVVSVKPYLSELNKPSSMDFKKTLGEAESVVNALGGLEAIPGAKRVAGAAHGAVHKAKAKAEAAGLGVMFTAI
jgi:hypothetical protein